MDIPLDLKLLMNQATISVTPSTSTTITTTTTSKTYRCEFCNATYSDKMYYDLHKQSHQKEVPVVQILMNPSGAHQLIPQPSPAHQGTAQIVIQDDQLGTYKRAYSVDPQQVYTLAPVSQYQVITANNRNGQSLQNQVNIPGFSAPTYVVATMADGHQIHALPEAILQHEQQQVSQHQHHQQLQQHQQQQQQHHQQQQQQQHHQHQQSSQITQQENETQDPLLVQVHQPDHIEVSGNNSIRIGRGVGVFIAQKDRPFKCDQCTASFIESNELEDHKKKHTGDGPFTCEDCHFTFMYRSHFKSHKTRCLKRRAMMPNPPKTIVNPTPVKRQFPTNHSQQQNSQKQNQQFQQQHNSQHNQQMQQQQIQVTQNFGKTFVSVINNKTNAARQGIKHSAQNKFNPSNPSFKRIKKESRLDRPYECDECDASFQCEIDLKNHKNKHTGDGPFTCDDCRFVFLYRKLYDAHRRRCEKKRKDKGLPISQSGIENDNSLAGTHHNATTSVNNIVLAPQITQVQSLQQGHHHNHHHQEISLQGGQTITAVPVSLPSSVLQMHTVNGQPTLIEMRPTNSQGQEMQQIQLPQHSIIEQVLVAPGTTMSTIGGTRHDIKYELVPVQTGVDSEGNVVNLIKVKGHNQ